MLAPIYKCICEKITSMRLQLRRHLWPSGPPSPPAGPCLRPYTGMRAPHARFYARKLAGNAGARFGGAGGDHAEKRCGETYVTPEIPEMIDEVMKEHRAGKLWRPIRNLVLIH